MQMIRRLDGSPDFLLTFGNAVGDRNFCFVRILVELEIIELKINAEFVRRGKFAAEARTHLVGAQHELAGANLGGSDEFDLVGENQRTGVEFLLLKMRDAKGLATNADVSALRVLDDQVQTIEAGAERHGLLVDRRKFQRGFPESRGR